MGNTFFFEWEVRLIESLQGFGGSFGVAVASLFTTLGDEMALIAVLGFIYWCYDKEFGKYVFTVFAPALVYAPMLKNIVCRRRPYMDVDSIKCLKPVDSSADIYDVAAQGYSFPSMHSANAAVVYGSLSYYDRKKRTVRGWMIAVSILLPLFVGISRSYLGVHFPTDVLIGWIFGVISLVVMDFIQTKVHKQWLLYLILILIAFPGVFFCTSNDYYTGFGIMIGGFAAFIFEEKKVKFSKPGSVVFMITRLIGGLAVFEALNFIFKLPFDSEFLKSATKAAFLIRLLRYTLVSFITIGVYPICFKLEGKLHRKEA